MLIAGTQRHRFVCADSGTESLVWVDAQGAITKTLPTYGACFDLWVLPDGNILYCHYGAGSDGVSIVDAKGNEQFRYETRGEVFGCQPLENGNILVGEVALKRLVEVTPDGTVAVEVPVEYQGDPHECMRMPRKAGESYLVVQPGLCKIRRYALDGSLLMEYATRHDTFGVIQRENGNLLYTCMEGAVELDPQGHEVWTLLSEDIPEIHICWLLGVQLLSNGNLVFSNWMGHGRQKEGITFFEVTPDKQVVWTADGREDTSLPATLQILEEDSRAVCFTPLR